jgi:hypothetical protein
MSFPGENRQPWDHYGPSYTNHNLPSEDTYYDNLPQEYAAGQLGKRTRSNSNEHFVSRLLQVQAWLKSQATAKDFEKIWQIFLGMPFSMAFDSLFNSKFLVFYLH